MTHQKFNIFPNNVPTKKIHIHSQWHIQQNRFMSFPLQILIAQPSQFTLNMIFNTIFTPHKNISHSFPMAFEKALIMFNIISDHSIFQYHSTWFRIIPSFNIQQFSLHMQFFQKFQMFSFSNIFKPVWETFTSSSVRWKISLKLNGWAEPGTMVEKISRPWTMILNRGL